MTFQDADNSIPITLASLVENVNPAQHTALRQLIHFLEDGPADVALSGAVKETLPSGNPFPTSVVWWTTAAKTIKYVEKLIVRNAQQWPTSVTWKMYDAAGSVIATIADAISYSGPFETSRTRTIS
jgi:hypothetical protein